MSKTKHRQDHKSLGGRRRSPYHQDAGLDLVPPNVNLAHQKKRDHAPVWSLFFWCWFEPLRLGRLRSNMQAVRGPWSEGTRSCLQRACRSGKGQSPL